VNLNTIIEFLRLTACGFIASKAKTPHTSYPQKQLEEALLLHSGIGMLIATNLANSLLASV
jgi:hypothetical protein